MKYKSVIWIIALAIFIVTLAGATADTLVDAGFVRSSTQSGNSQPNGVVLNIIYDTIIVNITTFSESTTTRVNITDASGNTETIGIVGADNMTMYFTNETTLLAGQHYYLLFDNNGSNKDSGLDGSGISFPYEMAVNITAGCYESGGAISNLSNTVYDLDYMFVKNATEPATPSITISYNSSVSEEANASHSILFEIYNITNNTTATLYYNGSTYGGAITHVNNSYVFFNTTLITPFTYLNNSAVSFYWEYNLSYANGSSTFTNSSSNNQNIIWNLTKYPRVNVTVYDIVNASYETSFTINDSLSLSTTSSEVYFYQSSAGVFPLTADNDDLELKTENVTFTSGSFGNYTFYLYTINSINFTFYTEETETLVTWENVSMEIFSTDGNASNYTTDTGYLYLDLLSPAFYTIRYYSTNFQERFYYLNLSNRTHTSVDLYCANKTLTSNVTATVYDETNSEVEDVYIKVLRYDIDTNTYILREIAKTNFEGEAILHLDLYSEFYYFILEYPFGTVKLTSSPTYIYDTSINFAINTGEEVGGDYYYSQGITYSLSFNNATNNVGYTYSDSNDIITGSCLKIYRLKASGSTLVNSSCSSSIAATILLNLDNSTGNTYEAQASINFSASEEYQLDSLIISFAEPYQMGNMGLIIVIVLTLVFAMVGFWSGSVAALLTPLPLFLAGLIGLVNISLAVTIPFLVIGGVIAYMLGNRG